ncbi:MAG: UDP-N-acetyl glucosamine 2-epimerase [Bifidobacteriaceae bacterium]|nr:UDP-N-acetyl glucosamine 2-epimerase [Bifidobacteriaceae bacterium]
MSPGPDPRSGPAAGSGTNPSPDGFYLATIHRPSNTDAKTRLDGIVHVLAGLDREVRLAAHPRLRAKAAELGVVLERGAIRLVEPLAYHEVVAAVIDSAAVVTDSGGLQKEAYLLGRPCTTLRAETEWVETLAGGWNALAPEPAAIAAAVARPHPTSPRGQPYGDGQAARRVAAALLGRA